MESVTLEYAEAEAVVSAADPLMGRLMAAVASRIGPQRAAVLHSSSFDAAARAVVYQSISIKAAALIYQRLREAYEESPTPERVLASPEDKLRTIGLSKAKAAGILGLAQWFDENRPTADNFQAMSDDEIRAELTRIPGIGVWTVNIFLIFHLRRPDVMPANDLGIRRGVQFLHGLETLPSPKETHEKALLWKPYRSIASLYLWKASHLSISRAEIIV